MTAIITMVWQEGSFAAVKFLKAELSHMEST
jgi:hypothetical protein